MNRDQLRTWLNGISQVLLGLAMWMGFVNFGPVAWVRPYVQRGGQFLHDLAASDVLLDDIIGANLPSLHAGSAKGVMHAVTPNAHDMAMLHKPTPEAKQLFVEAVTEATV